MPVRLLLPLLAVLAAASFGCDGGDPSTAPFTSLSPRPVVRDLVLYDAQGSQLGTFSTQGLARLLAVLPAAPADPAGNPGSGAGCGTPLPALPPPGPDEPIEIAPSELRARVYPSVFETRATVTVAVPGEACVQVTLVPAVPVGYEASPISAGGATLPGGQNVRSVVVFEGNARGQIDIGLYPAAYGLPYGLYRASIQAGRSVVTQDVLYAPCGVLAFPNCS